MPSQWGKGDKCPSCGVSYQKFRTGLRFSDIVAWFFVNSDDSKDWRYKRRRTILGAWHGAKLEGWEMHKQECAQQAEYAAQYVEGVPF